MKIDKELKAKLDALTDEQVDRKVAELRTVIPDLNLQLDYLARSQRDRRHAAARKALDQAIRKET